MTTLLLDFYKIWHGRFGLKGAGLAIRLLAPYSQPLQNYPLRLPEGHVIRLDFRDVHSWYWLNFTLGDHMEEAGLLDAICRIARPGNVIWDIGANAGLVSYVLARRLPQCRIFFFEPNSSVYSVALSALKPFGNAMGLNIGLSSSCHDSAPLFVPAGASTVGTLDHISSSRTAATIKVRLEAGDKLVKSEQVPAPAILKIDTEGHEPDTIAGLKDTILEMQPAIFFEHISLSDCSIENLVPDGYRLRTVCDKTGKVLPMFDRQAGHNSVLLPSET